MDDTKKYLITRNWKTLTCPVGKVMTINNQGPHEIELSQSSVNERIPMFGFYEISTNDSFEERVFVRVGDNKNSTVEIELKDSPPPWPTEHAAA